MGGVRCANQEFRIGEEIALMNEIVDSDRIHMMNDYSTMDTSSINP